MTTAQGKDSGIPESFLFVGTFRENVLILHENVQILKSAFQKS